MIQQSRIPLQMISKDRSVRASLLTTNSTSGSVLPVRQSIRTRSSFYLLQDPIPTDTSGRFLLAPLISWPLASTGSTCQRDSAGDPWFCGTCAHLPLPIDQARHHPQGIELRREERRRPPASNVCAEGDHVREQMQGPELEEQQPRHILQVDEFYVSLREVD